MVIIKRLVEHTGIQEIASGYPVPKTSNVAIETTSYMQSRTL